MLRRRSGFALAMALWLLVALGTFSAATMLLARDAVASARNRAAIARATWVADGCVNEVLAAVDLRLARDCAEWEWLDQPMPAVSSRCRISLRPVGLTLDVNGLADAPLTQVLELHGLRRERAESLAAAIIDWRDSDDDTRTLGAEREWYTSAGRPAPGNGPFASERELALVRGGDLAGLDSILGVERGPILLNRASLPVLVGIGLPTTVAEAVVGAQRERPFPSLAALAQRSDVGVRDSLFARFAELVGKTTTETRAWVLDVTASAPGETVEVRLELRLVQDGSRIAVIQRLAWP